MDEVIYRIKRSKAVIVFIGYFTLVIANIFVWVEYFVADEFHLVFPILFTLFGLGFTTPILLRVCKRDFYLIMNKNGFINRTTLNKESFISWSEVKKIKSENSYIMVDLYNHEDYISKLPLLNKFLSKLNRTTTALTTWYLEEKSFVIAHKMGEYAYEYINSNLVFEESDKLCLLGVYNTPFLGGDMAMIELEVNTEDIDYFMESTYVLTSYNPVNNQIPFSVKVIEESGSIKRVLFSIYHFDSKNALVTPLGNVRPSKREKLPERLEEYIDKNTIELDLILYEGLKPLSKSDIEGLGTAFIEFTPKVYQKNKVPKVWSENSIYFNLDYFEYLILFIPEEIDFVIYGMHSFSKEESCKYMDNMKLFISNKDDISTVQEFLILLNIDETRISDHSMKLIGDFLDYKEVVINSLNVIIKFIEDSSFEFSILGI